MALHSMDASGYLSVSKALEFKPRRGSIMGVSQQSGFQPTAPLPLTWGLSGPIYLITGPFSSMVIDPTI